MYNSNIFIRDGKKIVGIIEGCEDKVNWKGISCYQTLSEDFIREFKDKVDWYLKNH